MKHLIVAAGMHDADGMPTKRCASAMEVSA